MDVSYSVQLVVVVSEIVHSNSFIQEGFGQQYIYIPPLHSFIDMKIFTSPGMCLLEIGRVQANFLVPPQMPAIWADPRVESGLKFWVARD